MGTRPHRQSDTLIARKSAWLALTPEEWRQVKLLAFAQEVTEQELLSGWIRAALSRVQWLGVTAQRPKRNQ